MGDQSSPDILVIGYGNELRGDDGAGPAAARALEALRLPGVRVLIRPQLMPELAEDIAGARGVVFLDACRGEAVAEVTPQPLSPTARELGTHTSDPGALLALAEALYGRCPPAWLVAIPAACFDLGQALSGRAQAGLAAAVQAVKALCGQPPLAAVPPPR